MLTSLHLFQSQSHLKSLSLPCSLEITASTLEITLSVYYPPSLSRLDFFTEFQSLLEFLVSSLSECIVGNFNMVLDNLHNALQNFVDQLTISTFDLSQHISFPGHALGHTFDILINWSNSSSVKNISASASYLSDDTVNSAQVSFHQKPPPYILSLGTDLRNWSTFVESDLMYLKLF